MGVRNGGGQGPQRAAQPSSKVSERYGPDYISLCEMHVRWV